MMTSAKSRNMFIPLGLCVAFLFGVLRPSLALSQTSVVTGTVKDDSTQAPIAGANVYVAGTTLGTITTKEGKFEIARVPFGRREIVASMLGFYADSRRVVLGTLESQPLVFALRPQTYIFSPLTIKAEIPVEWRENLEVFKRAFIGTSANASECTIENPEVIDFTVTKDGALEASATSPFRIRNAALGYLIVYHGLTFLLDGEKISYQGVPIFQKMNSTDSNQVLRWEENRERAYRGSLRHFLIALMKGKAEKDGFIFRTVDRPVYNDLKLGQIGENDVVHLRQVSTYSVEIGFSRYLLVTFLRGSEPFEYREFRENKFPGLSIPSDRVSSWISLPYDAAIVDPVGVPQDPFMIHVYGYWGWLRLADTLPEDYVPWSQQGQ